MEHSWTEFRPLKNPQEGDPMRVQTISRIKLFGQKDQNKVKFNCEDNVGYWHYFWDADGPCYIAIEFKASQRRMHFRRHCLVQTMENTFELLPPEHPVYKQDDVWEHSKEVHQNVFPIVMQRLHVPTLKYMFQGDHSGAPSAVDLEEKAP